MRLPTEGQDATGLPGVARRTRREILRAAAASLVLGRVGRAEYPAGEDLAIDEATALIYSEQAPLRPDAGLKDARAVWCHAPKGPARTVLVYFHGHNGYVTVDARGRSRVPDWAAGQDSARAGASAKPAAPRVYGLDRLGEEVGAREPLVLVPEVSTLARGAFWAKEPAGQYADPARLGSLVADCRGHLARLSRPGGGRYLRPDGEREPIGRVYLCGHSGAGIPLEEAAGASLVLPGMGVPTDLWLFDCTYWPKVAGFIRFCQRWHAADRLAGGQPDASRLVCVYRPKTQTEGVADELRAAIAGVLGVDAGSLVKDHTPENFEAEVRPALRSSGVVFVRTQRAHDEIPGFFIPALIESAGS